MKRFLTFEYFSFVDWERLLIRSFSEDIPSEIMLSSFVTNSLLGMDTLGVFVLNFSEKNHAAICCSFLDGEVSCRFRLMIGKDASVLVRSFQVLRSLVECDCLINLKKTIVF